MKHIFGLIAAGFLAVLSTVPALAGAGVCPHAIGPNTQSGTSYILQPSDQCGTVVFTNVNPITVHLPGPGLIFSPDFTATLITLNGGQLTLITDRDTFDKPHTINKASQITLMPNASIELVILQDSNWYATVTLDGSYPQGSFYQALDHTFWGGPFIGQARFQRSFFGPCVQNSGTNSPFPNSDYYSQYQLLTPAVNSDATYSEVCILGDPFGIAGTPARIGTPAIGLFVANSSINAVSLSGTNYSTPRTLDLSGNNNVTAAPSGGGPYVPYWTIYAEAHRYSANAGQTYVAEWALINESTTVTDWTPEGGTARGTIVLDEECGGGYDPVYLHPCTVAQYISNNGAQFGAGIIFLVNSIGAYGPSSTIQAISMPHSYEIQWYNVGLTARIFGDSAGNLNLITGSNNIKISSEISSIANNATLNAPTGYTATLAVNGVSGVGYNGSNFLPIITNTVTLGTSSLEFSAGYIKTIVADALPTSAGAGGIYVCIDTAGVMYKKAACP